jgi:hypothetical protein
MSGDFYLTQGGHEFYFGTVPRIARALERIADALEKKSVIDCDHDWTPVQYGGMLSGLACKKCRVLLKEKDLSPLYPDKSGG